MEALEASLVSIERLSSKEVVLQWRKDLDEILQYIFPKFVLTCLGFCVILQVIGAARDDEKTKVKG